MRACRPFPGDDGALHVHKTVRTQFTRGRVTGTPWSDRQTGRPGASSARLGLRSGWLPSAAPRTTTGGLLGLGRLSPGRWPILGHPCLAAGHLVPGHAAARGLRPGPVRGGAGSGLGRTRSSSAGRLAIVPDVPTLVGAGSHPLGPGGLALRARAALAPRTRAPCLFLRRVRLGAGGWFRWRWFRRRGLGGTLGLPGGLFLSSATPPPAALGSGLFLGVRRLRRLGWLRPRPRTD